MSWAGAVDWLPPFIAATGLVGWVSDAVSDTVAIAMIAVGIVGSVAVRRFLPKEPRTTAPQ